MAVAIGGCESIAYRNAPQAALELEEFLPATASPDNGVTSPEPLPLSEPSATSESASYVEQGTGVVLNPEQGSAFVRESADNDPEIVLNFQAADIHEVVQVVVGDFLGLNYVIDPKVSGQVTTGTAAGLKRADLLPVLEVLLRHVDATLVQHDKLIEILPLSESRKLTSPTASPENSVNGYSTRIFTLQHVAVSEIRKVLEPLLDENSLLYVDETRNLLILGGTREELVNYEKTISTFDVNWMAGMSVALFKLKVAQAADLMEEVQALIGTDERKILDGLVRLIALERINALLAISPSQSALHEIGKWVKRLDIAGENSEPRLYVVRLQNAKAIDIADILGQILANRGGTSRERRGARLAPGARPVTVDSNESRSEDASTRSRNRSADRDGVMLTTNSDIRIIADETNNALVIFSTPREYELVHSAVERLDIVPLQVLIEASIIEVTLNDSLEYGVEWFFRNGFADDKIGEGLLDLGGAGISTTAPAFSYAVLDNATDVRVVLNALETESDVNILSSPSLMVLDNQTALINVGDEIPVPTRQSVSNIDSTARTVNEIQFRNTGVTLEVTPRINAGGLVTMEIEQEVSDAIPTTSSDLNAPTIQQRRISSTVAVQSGQTIVLGGLIRETRNENGSGIPYLRRLPVVGNVFGQRSRSKQRTELMVLITPRSVENHGDARSVTREYVEKMRGLNY